MWVIAVLPLASDPPFLWWVAPAVTFAAVCVALATSVAALRRQDRALEDNRRLRIADDVREVLAAALRDLHVVCRALEKAKSIPAANKRRARLYTNLTDATDTQAEPINRMIDSIEGDVRDCRHAADDAFDALQLQAARLGLLLGRTHSLYLEHMFGILLNLEYLRDLEIWELPVFDEDEQAAASAERQRQKFYERVIGFIDDLSGAGHAYVESHHGTATPEGSNA